MVKFLKAIAESTVYFTVACVSIGVLLALLVWASRHVTCFNLFDKVCVVW